MRLAFADWFWHVVYRVACALLRPSHHEWHYPFRWDERVVLYLAARALGPYR